MAYNLIVTERADELIENLAGYLMEKLRNPDAAVHFLDELDSLYDRLEMNPFQYSESRDPYLARRGYREAVFQGMSYRVVFRVEEHTVYIAGVYHNLENYGKKVEK